MFTLSVRWRHLLYLLKEDIHRIHMFLDLIDTKKFLKEILARIFSIDMIFQLGWKFFWIIYFKLFIQNYIHLNFLSSSIKFLPYPTILYPQITLTLPELFYVLFLSRFIGKLLKDKYNEQIGLSISNLA